MSKHKHYRMVSEPCDKKEFTKRLWFTVGSMLNHCHTGFKPAHWMTFCGFGIEVERRDSEIYGGHSRALLTVYELDEDGERLCNDFMESDELCQRHFLRIRDKIWRRLPLDLPSAYRKEKSK